MSSKRKRSRRITLLTLIIAVAAMLAMLGLVQAQDQNARMQSQGLGSPRPVSAARFGANGMPCRFELDGQGEPPPRPDDLGWPIRSLLSRPCWQGTGWCSAPIATATAAPGWAIATLDR